MNDDDPFLRRVHHELAASFAPDRTIADHLVREPIDIIGGFSDYAGATVISTLGDRATRVAVQPRHDQQIQVFSFDLYDSHKPFTLVAPLRAILDATDDQLREYFTDTNTRWAAIAIGVARQMLVSGGPIANGLSIAIQSDASHPAAMLSAISGAISKLLDVRPAAAAHTLAERVSRLCGEPIRARQVRVCSESRRGEAVRIKCQPGGTVEPLTMPVGLICTTRAIDFETPAWVATASRVRCASAMGHRLIVDQIRKMGAAAGRELIGDPTSGYLANVSLNDYRRFFRPSLPETLKGGTFLMEHRGLEDSAVRVEPDARYPVQGACDLHIFLANRVNTFVDCINIARQESDESTREKSMNKAGHLLYATHASLTSDVRLSCPDADEVVADVRHREDEGFYGANLSPTGVTILQKSINTHL